MKPIDEMTPVELLSEFCRKREYHETVAKARAWMQTDEAKGWLPGAGCTEPHVDHNGMRWLWVGQSGGHPLAEVREPRPEVEQRWAELCAEINRRFTPRRPPFNGPYR